MASFHCNLTKSQSQSGTTGVVVRTGGLRRGRDVYIYWWTNSQHMRRQGQGTAGDENSNRRCSWSDNHWD